jgi:hypothetical protein
MMPGSRVARVAMITVAIVVVAGMVLAMSGSAFLPR